jgi:hypothetical protein
MGVQERPGKRLGTIGPRPPFATSAGPLNEFHIITAGQARKPRGVDRLTVEQARRAAERRIARGRAFDQASSTDPRLLAFQGRGAWMTDTTHTVVPVTLDRSQSDNLWQLR